MAGKRTSAGVLVVRERQGELEYFLVHPGGPYFRNKDDGWWTIPKGVIEADEDALEAAQRELCEETGFALPDGPYLSIGEITQKGGKRVRAWAVHAELDAEALQSNSFEMEWPPRSGRRASFPEVDQGAWFDREAARRKVNPAQIVLLERAQLVLERTGE